MKRGSFALHKQATLLTRAVLGLEHVGNVRVVGEYERLEEVLIGKRIACDQIVQQVAYFVGWCATVVNDSFAHARCYDLLGYQVV